MEEFLPSEIKRAMAVDGLSSARPLSVVVKNSQQIRETFDEISYAKGKCLNLLLMLPFLIIFTEQEIHVENFQKC